MRIFLAAFKIVLVLLSLVALLVGGTIAYAEHAPNWLYANVGAAVLVILGFTSCTANLKWHGG